MLTARFPGFTLCHASFKQQSFVAFYIKMNKKMNEHKNCHDELRLLKLLVIFLLSLNACIEDKKPTKSFGRFLLLKVHHNCLKVMWADFSC